MAGETFTAAAVIAGYRRAVEGDQRKIATIMEFGAIAFRSHLQRSYPIGPTGNLRNRVVLDKRNETSWRVRAQAPHLFLWEHGYSRGGANTSRKAYSEVFIPSAIRFRAQSIRSVVTLLNRTVEV